MKLIPIGEYSWGDDYSMKTLTCINHQDARYTTKHPFSRTLHLLEIPLNLSSEERNPESGECLCPFKDLAVIEDEGGEKGNA